MFAVADLLLLLDIGWTFTLPDEWGGESADARRVLLRWNGKVLRFFDEEIRRLHHMIHLLIPVP